jgi:hypothetical protein
MSKNNACRADGGGGGGTRWAANRAIANLVGRQNKTYPAGEDNAASLALLFVRVCVVIYSAGRAEHRPIGPAVTNAGSCG